MKLLITTIAAVLLVGCGESSSQTPALNQLVLKCQHSHRLHHQKHNLLNPSEAATPEPPTAKAPDILAAGTGNIEAVKQWLLGRM